MSSGASLRNTVYVAETYSNRDKKHLLIHSRFTFECYDENTKAKLMENKQNKTTENKGK